MVLEQFNEGDIVITEGEAGSSLYVIVSGEVKVYTRGAKGESFFLARLGEGDFFGEVSVLTGKPRTATITAAQRTELLRLDKEKLDQIVPNFPRVKEILDEFYRRRASHTVEAMIEDLKSKR
jgi:cAMP-dependent protein kinase regulator